MNESTLPFNITSTALNTKVSPYFLVWKLGKISVFYIGEISGFYFYLIHRWIQKFDAGKYSTIFSQSQELPNVLVVCCYYLQRVFARTELSFAPMRCCKQNMVNFPPLCFTLFSVYYTNRNTGL